MVPDDPTPNVTQPTERPPGPPCIFSKGQRVWIKRHITDVEGIKITSGALYGNFIETFYGPNGEEYITIYHEGVRTFPLKHARKNKGSKASVTPQVKSVSSGIGKVTIECIGLPDKTCGAKREIHTSDKHLVKRCKECQRAYSKILNRERMRQRRAEKRKQREAEAKKKEMGRDS